MLCAEKGETERGAIKCCVLRGEELCGGRYSVVC